jgi:hydroxymethyl cephem carbamoyltransferase
VGFGRRRTVLILAVKPGHDGAVAALEDGRMLFSLESEKDSFPRHAVLGPLRMLELAEHLPEPPDVIAFSGWHKPFFLGSVRQGAGYHGPHELSQWPAKLFGRRVTRFTSSHERSHIAMAVGMAPQDDAPLRAVLSYEGDIGSFYLLDGESRVTRCLPVLGKPGIRYAFVYALADPTFPDDGGDPRPEDAGKLMALAAFAKPSDAEPEISDLVERIATGHDLWKAHFRDSPLYNIGVEAERTKAAAALITNRIFEIFARAAQEHLPLGLPLYISGGCGLNCEWNMNWRTLGHFSSVFVPPCTNDSGAALGTAIDAQLALTGDPHIEWDVYGGFEFEWDTAPDSTLWERRPMDVRLLADALAGGRVVAWVQGRWEIGPRALGNRSLLAEPFQASTRDRLNQVKLREDYRPIAPVCRIEDAGRGFDADFDDPYMLYFRRVKAKELAAITHVDGTARVQTVRKEMNPRLHDLLSAFAERAGIGVLCNTSLNFKGFGFINRMSDLAKYCEQTGVDDFVVGDAWFQRVRDEPMVAPW